MWNPFHNHQWKILQDKRIPSVVEEARNARVIKITSVNSWDLVVIHQTILTCEKCGKLKIIRMETSN